MKTIVKLVVVIFIIFYSSIVVYASGNKNSYNNKKEKWYKPKNIKLQYAGNIGFVSVGVGTKWWSGKAQSDIIYGYVPESEGKAEIHTFSLKNTFSLYEFNIFNKYNLSPIIGFSLSVEPGENSFARIPEKYPEGYYLPNNIYICFNLGAKSKFKLKEKRCFTAIEPYFEINTLADYGFYNIIAKEDRDNQIFSLGMGVNLFF